MKTTITTFLLIAGTCFGAKAQENNNPTIAVALPSVQNINIPQKTSAKMINLELIKLKKFNVYDEFDVTEVMNTNPAFSKECFGLNCLSSFGKALKVDYVISGGIDRIGNKIIISLKIIDIRREAIYKSSFKEFGDQEEELQRMIELTLREMLGFEVQADVENQLSYKNDVIISGNLGKINNSGPRVGYAIVNGSLAEFASRSEEEGGLDVVPAFSMIGYQLEKQYIGTENFSALIESFVNVSGLEQGLFIPSVSIMNGFRFGKSGFEFAFGPSFGVQATSKGFFDSDNVSGKGAGYYWREEEYRDYANKLIDPNNPQAIAEPQYKYATHLDSRGATSLSTRWVMGIGRTFKSGALNIPVNVFYSSTKKGGMLGLSVGFNVIKKKETTHFRN